jgi:hypothetical protein
LNLKKAKKLRKFVAGMQLTKTTLYKRDRKGTICILAECQRASYQRLKKLIGKKNPGESKGGIAL